MPASCTCGLCIGTHTCSRGGRVKEFPLNRWCKLWICATNPHVEPFSCSRRLGRWNILPLCLTDVWSQGKLLAASTHLLLVILLEGGGGKACMPFKSMPGFTSSNPPQYYLLLNSCNQKACTQLIPAAATGYHTSLCIRRKKTQWKSLLSCPQALASPQLCLLAQVNTPSLYWSTSLLASITSAWQSAWSVRPHTADC